MAIENVNAILQAFQHSLAAKQQRDQFLQEIELRRQDRELREREFEQQKKQFDIQQEAAKKYYDLQRQLQEANLASQKAQFGQQSALNYAQWGITPPGTTIERQPQQVNIPGTGGVQGPFVNVPGMQLPTGLSSVQPSQADIAQQRATLVNPLFGQAEGPTPEAFQARELERQKALLAQQESAELARASALRKINFQDQIAIMGMQQKFQNDQRIEQENFQKSQQSARLANTMAVAKLKNMGGLTGFGGTVSYDDEGNPVFMPNNPSDIVNAVRDKVRTGDMTQEELKTRFPVSKPAGQIINADLQENDLKPLTKKQLDDLRELEKVAKLVDKVKELVDIRKDHPFLLQMPMGPIKDKWNRLREEVVGDTALLSKWKNTVPRFTNFDLGLVKDAILPSSDWVQHSGVEEYKKYYSFIQAIQDSFNTTLSDVSETQRTAIRDKMNLNKFPFIGSAIKTPGAPVPRIGGATPPSERTGGEQQILTVIEKATGRKGRIGINKYNANKDKYQIAPQQE